MNKFVEKLSKHPWLVLLLLVKGVYDVIIEVLSWQWNRLNLDFSNFNVFIDLLVMSIVVFIIVALLNQIKKQKEELEAQKEAFNTRKRISSVVDLARAELNYTKGATFSNSDKKESFVNRYLQNEQSLVEERLAYEFSNLSTKEIRDLMFDFYGYSLYE